MILRRMEKFMEPIGVYRPRLRKGGRNQTPLHASEGNCKEVGEIANTKGSRRRIGMAK